MVSTTAFSIKHRRDLMEVARFHQYIGCLQVTNHNEVFCARIVATTHQETIIQNIIDTRTNEGQNIIDKIKIVDKIKKSEETHERSTL